VEPFKINSAAAMEKIMEVPQEIKNSWVLVVDYCNLIYSGVRDREDPSWRPAQAKKLTRPHLNQ
jgi:hypothetical protein